MEAQSKKSMSNFPGRSLGIVLGALACFFAIEATAQQIPIVEHLPIPAAQENSPVKVEARVSAPGRSVVYARVYFRSLAQQNFRYVDMRPTVTGYGASIPASAIRPPLAQYFILILFSDQNVVTYPERNPYGQPFEIIVNETKRQQPAMPLPTAQPPLGGQQNVAPSTQPEGEAQQASPQILEKLQRLETQPTMAQQPDTTLPIQAEALPIEDDGPILILSPEPFSSIAANDLVIAASFMTDVPVDSSSIRVALDSQDITEEGEVSPVLISISPQIDVSPGEHKVVITAKDINGNTLAPLSWRFSIIGEEDVEVTTKRSFATGVVFAETRREKFSGIKLSNNNFGANITGGFGMIGYSGQLYITSLEDAAFQPRNRFGFTAGGKLLTVSLGDMNPRFDELILWGQRVRGFGASLHLGSIFNVDFVTGTTNRTVAAQYFPGTTTLLRSGTFERRLMGIRPSFGGGQNFQWGLTLLKVRDQVNSLKAGESSVTPKDNLVVGSDLLIAFDSHRFELKGSAAVSLTSNDITNGASSKDSIKAKYDIDPPFDPKSFEKYFIINESTFPLDPTKGNSLAYIVTLRMNYFNNYLQLGFKRLGDSYSSLGNSFLRNDVKGFFVNDRLRLFRNRVYLNLGLERYNENFSENTNTPKIDLNTFSYGLSIFWGQNLPSLNFNVRNYRRDNNIDTLATAATVDTREDALTRDFNFSINYDAALFNLNHTLTLNLTSSNRDDSFAGQRLAGVPPGNLNSNVQLISVRTKYDFPLTSTLTYARNSSNIANGANTLKYNLISGRGEYSMLQEKLKAYGGLRLVSASGASAPTSVPITGGVIVSQNFVDYKQTAFQLGGSYQPAPAHMFTLDFDIIKFSNNGGTRSTNTATSTVSFAGNPSSNDSMIRAHYEFRF